MRKLSRFAGIAGVCLVSLLAVTAAGAVELITDQEAKLPDDDTESRGIFRGPKVHLINPAPKAGLIKSPFNLKVKFESFGGAKVDTDSILVTYKKTPLIDLTQRMKPFIQASGINLDSAEVPAGEHRIRVDVKDSKGQAGMLEFTIKVSK
jgi:hypothetical protein